MVLINLVIHTAMAQKHSFTTQYSISFALPHTKDFINNVSFRGFTFDYKYHQSTALSFGLSAGWYAFYEEKDFDTYETADGASFSGKQYRYLNSLPVLFTIDYFFYPNPLFALFLGVGAGMTYNRQDTAMTLYSLQIDPWHFALAPQIGVILGLDAGISAYLSTRYNINFETEELGYQSYMGLNIGLTYHY
jgi:hypothetical protein